MFRYISFNTAIIHLAKIIDIKVALMGTKKMQLGSWRFSQKPEP